tara:strand:- start:204 stop:311 length:108 start_codon:yes stop_codon:yes gene_type:complete
VGERPQKLKKKEQENDRPVGERPQKSKKKEQEKNA